MYVIQKRNFNPAQKLSNIWPTHAKHQLTISPFYIKLFSVIILKNAKLQMYIMATKYWPIRNSGVKNTPNKPTVFPISKIICEFVNEILSMLENDHEKVHITHLHRKYLHSDDLKGL